MLHAAAGTIRSAVLLPWVAVIGGAWLAVHALIIKQTVPMTGLCWCVSRWVTGTPQSAGNSSVPVRSVTSIM